MLLLNIGTARKGRPNLLPQRIVTELDHAGFAVQAHTIHKSDTEPTLVALVKAPKFAVDERIHSISAELGQECIAVYDTLSGKGRLIGPKAEAWGEFNPEFFLLINGDRLGTNFSKAA